MTAQATFSQECVRYERLIFYVILNKNGWPKICNFRQKLLITVRPVESHVW